MTTWPEGLQSDWKRNPRKPLWSFYPPHRNCQPSREADAMTVYTWQQTLHSSLDPLLQNFIHPPFGRSRLKVGFSEPALMALFPVMTGLGTAVCCWWLLYSNRKNYPLRASPTPWNLSLHRVKLQWKWSIAVSLGTGQIITLHKITVVSSILWFRMWSVCLFSSTLAMPRRWCDSRRWVLTRPPFYSTVVGLQPE